MSLSNGTERPNLRRAVQAVGRRGGSSLQRVHLAARVSSCRAAHGGDLQSTLREKRRLSAMATRPTALVRRRFAVLIGAAMLLAACGSGDPKGGAGGRGGRGGAMGPTRSAMSSSSRAARRSSGPSRAGLGLSGLRRSSAGLRRDPSPAVPRRLGRPPGPDPLSDRSERLYGAGRAGAANLQSARASAEAARTLAARYGRWSPSRRSRSRTIPMPSRRRAKRTRRSHRMRRRSGPPRSTSGSPACRRRSPAGSACPPSPRARW